jgi:hypothetical protein
MTDFPLGRVPCIFFLHDLIYEVVLYIYITQFLQLAYWQVGDPSVQLVQRGRECTPPYICTETVNLLQPAQAEAMLADRSM